MRFAEYRSVFDDLYTNMVEAGETGGILDGGSTTAFQLTSRKPSSCAGR